jgi:PncC family amidohydrolase
MNIMDRHRNPVDQAKVLGLRDLLQARHERLVLAESCTAGLIAALLGQVPGISEFLCGSMVVYQTPIKHQWLGISSEDLTDPSFGPVSARVTEALARAILARTPQATLAASITGHLGPSAPADLDGVVYCSIVTRASNAKNSDSDPNSMASTKQFQLSENAPQDSNDLEGRRLRQHEAAGLLIEHLSDFLRDQEKPR